MTDVAVLTGASSGLGFEIAALLRGRGMSVVGVARRGPDIKGDAAERRTALAALAEAKRRGTIRLLVNCAGAGIYHPAGTYTPEEIDEVLRSNLISMINFCDGFIQHIQGTIVNVMSTAALTGKPGETVYCAAKWGARGYTEALRAEVKGTRILAVYPGGMKTPFWSADPGRAVDFMDPKEVAAKIVEAIFDSDLTELVLRRA
ncbi:MAG TPA: SDR family oxidoreductase [Thermoanaerobaculia bacterium]|nr:SDR family oxidoreductase [Thermoanaerobaculia bacterium]